MTTTPSAGPSSARFATVCASSDKRAAKALGVKVPKALLLAADAVLE